MLCALLVKWQLYGCRTSFSRTRQKTWFLIMQMRYKLLAASCSNQECKFIFSHALRCNCSYVRSCLIPWENQLLIATALLGCLLFLSLLVAKYLTWHQSRYAWVPPTPSVGFCIIPIQVFNCCFNILVLTIYDLNLLLDCEFFKKWHNIWPNMFRVYWFIALKVDV